MYNLTPQDFKDYFKKGEFVYSSYFEENVEYKKSDVVYYSMDYYKSLVNHNIDNVPDVATDFWSLEPLNSLYVWDDDIDKAFIQASGNFNPKLFPKKEEELAKVCFLMLTAHYILQDYNMVSGNSQVGVMTSKSIGGVSASYQIPETYLKNPLYSYLSTTPFGLKYLSYIANRSVGNVAIVKGRTNVN
jgi:hypothetical protein